MAKREEFVLTLEQCQRLTETCLQGRSSFPKKWGEKDIPIDEQLTGREDLGDLLKVLRSYSPWLQGIGKDRMTIFGEKADWYPVDKDGAKVIAPSNDDDRIASWKMVDRQKTYKLRMGREALSGAVWCCIFRLHVHNIIDTTTTEAVDTWWPLAEALGKATAIRKYIGIASAKRSDWEDDPDTEEKDGGK